MNRSKLLNSSEAFLELDYFKKSVALTDNKLNKSSK
jgi:hypothetical protein